MMQDLVDMDTHEKIRYISESSNASTSGYSTMSPGAVHHMSPASFILSSPAHSPATIQQGEFSNSNHPQTTPQVQYTNMSNVYNNYSNYNSNTMTGNIALMHNQFSTQAQQQYNTSMPHSSAPTVAIAQPKNKYPAVLRINEQPVEKFRFRYKSEMHGTHGSLNGANSKRTPKTYPEVELLGFEGRAIIRCSLFQANLDSPHSHQLVVRRDDTDICDPHDLQVSPENGFVAMFQNMGIIHTAKKYIFQELLEKKMNRLKFDQGREELSTKQIQELNKETEKEAKDMNLNQVRLCFEAFKIEENKSWTRIAEPVYTKPINNRKSAQTGELRIVRLSIATGSVSGGDDLILLVEKVSKKNIKVRFFEENEDGDTVWEAFGNFREADVHHQYAIVCQTPSYKDKEIEKPVEVNIELIRPSDDERSFPPVVFRYKPKDSVVSRKRRRVCSSGTSSSGSGSSVNSFEVPKTVQEQHAQIDTTMTNLQTTFGTKHAQTISEEFNKNDLLDIALKKDSAELIQMCFLDLGFDIEDREGFIAHDGVATKSSKQLATFSNFKKTMETALATIKSSNKKPNSLERIFKIFDETYNEKHLGPEKFSGLAKEISSIYTKHAEKNDHGDSIIHDLIINDNKVGKILCHIISFFKQNELFNRILNSNNESVLHYACLYNRTYYIRTLLLLGCDPNIQDKHGNTALHVAVREQHLNCIESFLNMKNIHLDLSLRNDDGLTQLHLAIAQQNIDIAKKLIEYNHAASLVPNGKDGNNALHMAVRQQRLDLIKLILNDNVDKHSILSTQNTAGHTALDIAKCLNTKVGNEIACLLLPTDMDQDPGELTIKEEEISSSSTDEDETEESTNMNENIIKEEYDYEERIEELKENESLSDLLCNEKKFRKIAKLLNENSKWRQLAKNSNMQKFLCLWSSAEDMLDYVQKKQNINNKLFISALTEVDRDALDVLMTPMT